MTVEKVLVSIALVFIALEICVMLSTPRVTGYEASICDAYPSYFWLFLGASVASGVSVLVRQGLTEKEPKWWMAGMAVIVVSNIVFLILPTSRGYVFHGRGDALTHLRLIKDIIATGHVGPSNSYPIPQILGAIRIPAGCSTLTLFKRSSCPYRLSGACLLVLPRSPIVFQAESEFDPPLCVGHDYHLRGGSN